MKMVWLKVVLVLFIAIDNCSCFKQYGVFFSRSTAINHRIIIRLSDSRAEDIKKSPITDVSKIVSIDTSSSSSSSIRKQSIQEIAADALIGSAFKIRPLFLLARSKARNSMVERGDRLGISWKDNIDKYKLSMDDLQQRFDRLSDSQISYPDYYMRPFHAYDEGNLSWQAAMEVESAAVTVHSQIYIQQPDDLDGQGDFTLRDNFHKKMRMMLDRTGFQPRRVLDIGCSTGLSTLKLHNSFPSADIIGIDLSPYMIAVADHQLYTDVKLESARKYVQYMHRAGEDTGIGSSDVDLVTISLVSHELPQAATKDILFEAYRILPRGGAIAIMDMNPDSTAFRRVSSNPFAFAAFKSTEPWIQEYVSMDLYNTLRMCGFRDLEMMENSPRHRTVVAYK